MPSYTVTHPTTGRQITITGDTPPSEAELDGIFAQTGKAAPPPPDGEGYINITAPLPGQKPKEQPSIAEEMDKDTSGVWKTPGALKSAIELRKAADMKRAAQPVIDEMGPVQKGIVGVGAGMYDAYKGAQQAGAELGQQMGLVDPTTVARITQEGQDARDSFAPLREQSTAAKIGEFGGKIAPFLAIPGAAPESALARFAVGAGTGAGMGALEFVPEGGSRLANTATGAALGGAGSLVLSGAGKVLNAAAHNPTANMAVQKLSNQFKIPTTLSELTGKANRTDTIMERVPGPFGIKGFREAQQQAAKDAATSHFSQYVVGASRGRATADIKVTNDAYLDSLYQQVRQHATSIPQAAAPEVKQTAREILDRYPTVFDAIQDTHIKKILGNIVGDTATQTKTIPVMNELGQAVTVKGAGAHGAKAEAVNLLGPNGKAIVQKVEPKFSFDDLWTLRKGLGQEIGDASTNTAKSQLNALYSAVSADMDTMLAGHSDDALKAFKTANDAFKRYSLKFDAMRQAYDKAMGTTGAGNMGFFSPQKYGTALKNLANDPNYKKNIKWTPQEVAEMTGLANILQVTKRAGQFMENPPTGNRFGMPSLATAAGGGSFLAGGVTATVKTAGASAAAALITKFLTTTPAGKRLALAGSKIEPQSRAMGVLMQQIYQQLPKFTAEMGLSDPLGIRQ